MPTVKPAQHADDGVRRISGLTLEPDLASEPGTSHCHRDRILVDIKVHECAIIPHASSPLCMRLCYV